jgi:hypothetical protein
MLKPLCTAVDNLVFPLSVGADQRTVFQGYVGSFRCLEPAAFPRIVATENQRRLKMKRAFAIFATAERSHTVKPTIPPC